MTEKCLALLCVSFALWTSQALCEETKEQHDARLKWFREAKFGMFIHWGVYAVPAGTYDEKRIGGIGEWIMNHGKIPPARYRTYASNFNPVKYDPKAWADLAKAAGMKYIIITAKHHDGFCLFPSDTTDWDVADTTPYKKDLITPLAAAARKDGLKFGTYFSQAQDWTSPGGAKAGYKEGEGWDPAHKGNFDQYLAQYAVPQAREILTRIKPDVLWWDTPIWMTPERAKPLNDLIALRPGLITNNRLGGGYRGDTETPEQFVPATGFKDRDWETCMTMNDTWGYKSYDQNWKSSETLLRNLVDIVSKGGNYLLNVGPTAEGEIPAPSIERLQKIGLWMKTNGESIYATTASPFTKLAWGRCTKKLTNKGGTLYFHVFDWPADGKLMIPGLTSEITKAKILATGAKVATEKTPDGVTLALPQQAPDAVDSVVCVTFKGPLQVTQKLPSPQADGSLVLTANDASIHNSLHAHAQLAGRGDATKIANWTHYETRISWDFQANAAAKYQVVAEVAGKGGGRLALALGKKTTQAQIPATDSEGNRTVDLGTVSTPAAGTHTLELQPNKEDWRGLDLLRLRLIPTSGEKQ